MNRVWTFFWQHGAIAMLSISLIAAPACTQAQVDAVLSDADLILQTAQSLDTAIGAVGPADAAALSLLTGVAITGVNAIKTAYDSYEANKTASNAQNVIVAAQAIQSNLGQELAALHISSPNATQKATAWVNLVTSVIADIVGIMGVATSQTATLSAGAQSKALPAPEELKARWLAEVCSGDTSCGDLVTVHHKHAPRKLKL